MAKRTGDIELIGSIITADGATAGVAGDTLTLTAGAGHATSGDGGAISITAGDGVGVGAGGNITLTPGVGAGVGSAGAVVISDSAAPTSTTNKLYSLSGVLTWNGLTLDTGGGGIGNVVEDTTPQLGGNLDVNGNGIVSVSNGDIDIIPNGTGKTKITNIEAPLPINTQAGTTYTAVLADASKVITLNNAAAIAMTIPANASVAYPIGTKLNFEQLGVGTVTIGITTDTLNLNAGATAVMNGQYSIVTALKITSTSWVLFGQLVPASPPLTSVAVSDLDDGTDGELITWDSAGVATTVAVGTATQVLTSNGAGAEPTFQAIPSGATPSGISDADGDTSIETDTSDDDFIRFDTGVAPVGFPANANTMTLASSGLTVALPTANVATTVGAPISLTGGTGNTTGAGGDVDITAGAGGATGDGGVLNLYAGAGGATSGDGANVTIYGGGATEGSGGNIDLNAGAGAGTNMAGGAVTGYGGDSTGTQAGGPVSLTAGAGGVTGDGGVTSIIGGAGGATSGAGGALYVTGGAATTAGDGGAINIAGGAAVGSGYFGGDILLDAGAGGADGYGGDVDITGGAGTGSYSGGEVGLAGGTAVSGAGGAAIIKGGLSSAGVGGDVVLVSGTGSTTDTDGAIVTTAGAAGVIESVRGYIAADSTGAAALIATIPLSLAASTVFEIFAIAREDAATETAAFRIFGAVENTGGTAAIVGSTVKDRTDDAGASVDWDVTIGVTGASMTITVDNDAETVDWKFKVHLTEL